MNCNLCPRKCNADRTKSVGFCGATDTITVSKAYLHKWEEPCISGENGSGTVFFSPCNLKCVYCQNYDISHSCKGAKVSIDALSQIFLNLQEKGANNINLVTPTPFADKIAMALRQTKPQLHIPVVYNCSGYERTKTLEEIADVIDIFIPDIKFKSASLSKKYLNITDYFETTIKAIDTMCKITGTPQFDGEMLQKGVIVRHLVMPNCYKDSIEILRELYKKFGVDKFLLSLMSQYIPCGNLKNFPEINRKITTFEYNKVIDFAASCNFNGFTQDKSSATEKYIPDFDNEGVNVDE